ncbi:23S rRNA (uracil(1939)-C(5))-methyltransferase RlmD [Anaerovorax odorimutans]|uniref:23S rRNA (uracil(1939)-C(5))-methyltransferase RlmD n=1 Tax=Anaerovorax odorimutans TaxID=109327 RepID=UPI000413CCBA|nr:23S rRNA (uracil(1939)-C(5))-methyltransferase RlmD [Anaerovorax odorimutans]
MEKGQVYEIKIEDMSTEGQGIGRVDGMAVFAAGAIIGDTALVKLTKVKKKYAFGRVLEIKEPSHLRITPSCKYAKQCGGCALQDMKYEGQLEFKRKMVFDRLTRLGGIENPKVNETIGMESPYRYRNKAQMPISCGGIITRKGGILENLGECTIGFYKFKSHEVVDCDECLIQSEPVEKLAQAVRQYMKEDNITAWDPNWEKGLMRHLVVKTAHNTGEVMAILVINGKGIPNGEKLIGMMDDAVNEIPTREDGIEYSLESIVINVNKKKTSEIMGDHCITLAGKPTILERVGEMSFEISPMSFYQVNPEQMVKLYDKVLDYAELTGKETVLDLYCGVGTIGLYCASKANKVIGIESVKGAVIDANRNAVINGVVNAEFICGKVEEELPKLLEVKDNADEDFNVKPIKPDVVILDPPRSGCYPDLLEIVADAEPERIVYVSCDPATLARDVKILREKGYGFVEATPVDMFPWTMHIETVCLLTLKNQ